MTDDHLIGRVLELQSQRITRLQQSIDKLTAETKANGDSIDRLRRTMREGDTK